MGAGCDASKSDRDNAAVEWGLIASSSLKRWAGMNSPKSDLFHGKSRSGLVTSTMRYLYRCRH